MATHSCHAAEHAHVQAPSRSQPRGRLCKCVSRADAFAITISPPCEWFARPMSLPIRSHLVWNLPSNVPSIAAAGKTVATSNKNTSNVANVNTWGPWWGSNSSKFCSYSPEASAARIRTGTEHQGLHCHLTSTPASSRNSGSGRSRKRRNSVKSKKEDDAAPSGFPLGTPVSATHAETNSLVAGQRQKRAQYISGVASTTGARGTARMKSHRKKLESVLVSGAHRAPHVLTVLRESINSTAEHMCATHQPRMPLRCGHANVKKMPQVTVQHTLAEWKIKLKLVDSLLALSQPYMYWCFHLSFAAVLRHQLSLHVDQMSLYRPPEWMDCESHLATRHLSRNTKEGPCHSQERHTGETTPALQPQEHCLHNTSVALKAAARAQPPSSLILLQLRPRFVSDVFVS